MNGKNDIVVKLENVSFTYKSSEEKVIKNVNLEAKDLIAHCQLNWQEQCCDFHLNKSAAVTASATQVRQSIYTSSMQKWRHYEKQLSSIMKRLDKAGISYR